jgi:hypothetical protein
MIVYEEEVKRDIDSLLEQDGTNKEEEEQDSVVEYGSDSDSDFKNSSSDDEKLYEEEQEKVKTSIPNEKRKKRKHTAQFDKVIRNCKIATRSRKMDISIVQHQRNKPEDNKLDCRINNKKKRLIDIDISTVLHEPVGFSKNEKIDVETMEKRIMESKKNELKIDRNISLLRTRYIPFGNKEFYKRTSSFYSKPTKLCCCWCTEPFKGNPIPLPIRYKENPADRSDYVFHVTSQYCSPHCMLAQLKKNRSCIDIGRLLLKKVYGLNFVIDIKPAPDPRSLKKFGGYYTIDEFRATGGSGIKTSTIKPPLLPMSIGLTEIESTETIISEVGGKELARKRIRVRGGGTGTNHSNHLNNPFSNPTTKQLQRGAFTSMPTIEEQINQSDRKLRLQMQTIGKNKRKKKADILSFMKKKK